MELRVKQALTELRVKPDCPDKRVLRDHRVSPV
jgi:hypothetical protein